MQKIKPIMFVGTGSDVGKSAINAAFCRIFLQDGYAPAPFKAQNMSLNSYATPDGLEIGRAQAAQAEACGIECSVEMNPVLLKPNTNISTQVVLNGKPIGNQTAQEYFLYTDRTELFKEAMKSYNRLEEKYNPVVIEGAGSISEVNLWDKDIVNMKVAVTSGASTYLIADIDRGGVIGSVYGTIMLLPQEERDAIKGIIINKFRGDLSLFEEGKRIIKELTGKPVVGVIPYFRDIYIEQEDAVVIQHKTSTAVEGKINVAVVLVPHMSNFTDFNMIEHLPEVHLYYTDNKDEIAKADMVILPGSKSTLADLKYITDNGVATQVKQMHAKGTPVYGICGGYQMMGTKISDPHHVESEIDEIEGLGLLPVETILSEEKKTVQSKFSFLGSEAICDGYEIHMGETIAANPSPLCITEDGEDGYYKDAKTWGSYMHGIMDNPVVLKQMLQQLKPDFTVSFNYKEYKNQEYDKLANVVREACDMDYIYETLEIE